MKTEIALPSWAIVSGKRAQHIARVAALTQCWAAERAVGEIEAQRWLRAAQVHDALRDAPVELLRDLTPVTLRDSWPPRLWHGPAAAARAHADGETDEGILNAVRYHTVGYAGWDDCGRMLYLADYLEPGRRHERAALDALAARVPTDVEGVMREVTQRRMRWLSESGTGIRPETLELWNSLVPAG